MPFTPPTGHRGLPTGRAEPPGFHARPAAGGFTYRLVPAAGGPAVSGAADAAGIVELVRRWVEAGPAGG